MGTKKMSANLKLGGELLGELQFILGHGHQVRRPAPHRPAHRPRGHHRARVDRSDRALRREQTLDLRVDLLLHIVVVRVLEAEGSLLELLLLARVRVLSGVELRETRVTIYVEI